MNNNNKNPEIIPENEQIKEARDAFLGLLKDRNIPVPPNEETLMAYYCCLGSLSFTYKISMYNAATMLEKLMFGYVDIARQVHQDGCNECNSHQETTDQKDLS